MKFTKMQGIGNDYIYVNCFEETVEDPSGTAKRISDRHFGVGSDGLVLICPDPDADFRMRMFNSDGSESEMCGNAVRCIGKYVYERGLTKKTEVQLGRLNRSGWTWENRKSRESGRLWRQTERYSRSHESVLAIRTP